MHPSQLPTAQKRDSQGICFIGKRDFPSFISSYIPCQKGHLVNQHGSLLAPHAGHFMYTIGQTAALGGQPERLYVAAKDAATNRVLVVPVRATQSASSHPTSPSHPPSSAAHTPSSTPPVRACVSCTGSPAPPPPSTPMEDAFASCTHLSHTLSLFSTDVVYFLPPPQGCFRCRIRHGDALSPCVVTAGKGGELEVVFDGGGAWGVAPGQVGAGSLFTSCLVMNACASSFVR